MPAWLLPLALSTIAGGLGFLGGERANKANKQQAKEQMDFQERMSSTAAQRSVQDFRAAGLNPALAYDRQASSPGGAAAVIGNSVKDATSSASNAYQLQQAMKQAREQHYENLRNTRALTDKAVADKMLAMQQAEATHEQAQMTRQQWLFNQINQPVDLRHKTAAAILQELLIPGARNTASFEEMLGKGGKGIATAKTLSEIIKALNPRDYMRR